MKQDRLGKLLDNKIYIWRNKKSGKFLTLCQKRVIKDRILQMNEDMSLYDQKSMCIEETIYRFVTDDLIEKLCKQCNENTTTFISIEKGWHTFCSGSCASKYKSDQGITWVNQPGWTHTEKSKKIMSENHADFSGSKNPFKIKMETDAEFRQQFKDNVRERWNSYTTDELNSIREIFSKAQANSLRDSESYHKNHKSGWFESDKMGKKMFYRSSWEKRVCEFLEYNNEVIKYQIEPFLLPYTDMEGLTRHTKIDFYVEHVKGNYIMEVKPSVFLEKDNTPFKINAYREYSSKNNMKFILITEKELENLGDLL